MITFGDFIFYGYNKYYPYTKRDVMAEQNTWWWKLIYGKMAAARFLIICHDMMSDGFEAADNAIAAFLREKGLDVRFVSLHETGTHDKTNEIIGITKNAPTSCHPDDHGTTAIANYVYSQVGSWLDR